MSLKRSQLWGFNLVKENKAVSAAKSMSSVVNVTYVMPLGMSDVIFMMT